MPAAANNGAVSSKIRPFDSAIVIMIFTYNYWLEPLINDCGALLRLTWLISLLSIHSRGQDDKYAQ